MIRTAELQFRYDKENAFSFPDLSCAKGEMLLILGKSGIGKSTLLNLLGGLMKPNHGSIQINETELVNLGTSTLDRFRGENIGIIFQKNHFIESLNVLENLLLSQKLAGAKVDKAFCLKTLETLNIQHKAKSKIRNLSEGEKQRVNIARAVVHKPKVVLADEPTSALDDENCAKVVELLRTQAQEIGAALLIVTHDTRLKNIVEKQIVLS